MPSSVSPAFVERRLGEWLEAKQVAPNALSGGLLQEASGDLGFDVSALQAARASLVEKSAAQISGAGSGAKRALALGELGHAATPGKSIATGPIGLRMSMTKKAEVVDLRTMPRTFDELADKFRKAPGSAELRARFQALTTGLTATVEVKEEKLAPMAQDLGKREALLNWFQRNVGIFAPTDVRDLRREVRALENEIGEAKAFRGGASIALRSGQAASPDMNPASWQSRLNQSTVPQTNTADSSRIKGVADLVKLQDQITQTTDRAHLEQRSIDADVTDFSKEVKWHQRWKWVDVVIGGESGRGALYRAGKDMNKDAVQLVGELDAVCHAGENRTLSEVNELLKLESPKYREMRARYDKLAPVYESVTGLLRAASEAQDALQSAEHWIDRRNMLKAMEPTRYETVTEKDINGKETQVQRETSAYQAWESQYSHANTQAQWSASRAESEVRSVNQDLPKLRTALDNLGDKQHYLGTVDSDIGAFWGQFASFFMWSYDSSQVDQIQNQMSKLEGQLHEIKGQVEPDYTKHKSWVFGEIGKRRNELRSEPN